MGTADPKLDGRFDGVFTAASLPLANTVQPGTRAFTSDYGPVFSNGSQWVSSDGAYLSGNDPRLLHNVPLTGFDLQMADITTHLQLQPAGTLATGTVRLPANPYDAMEIAIGTTATITALTLNGGGKTINGAVTTLAANAAVRYKYRFANTSWYRSG